MTASLGAVVIESRPVSPYDMRQLTSQLINQADQAMYRAKRQGGNQAVVDRGWSGQNLLNYTPAE